MRLPGMIPRDAVAADQLLSTAMLRSVVRLSLCAALVLLASCQSQPKAASPGEALFLQRCAVCHSAGGAGGQGPSLQGLMGRKAGSVPGFQYSAALKQSGITWDGKSLDHFLAAPGAAVPGTLMVLAVPDPTERKDLVHYLASFGGSAKRQPPAPKPAPTNVTQVPPAAPAVLNGKAAFGDYRTDGPGVRRHFTVADLPAPNATDSAHNPPDVTTQPAGFKLQAPPGFSVEMFAKGLEDPRLIRTAPNGDIFIAESAPGRIRVIRTHDGATQPDSMETFAQGLDHPFGIAFYPPGPNPTMLYVANTNSVVKFPYKVGDLKADTGPATSRSLRMGSACSCQWAPGRTSPNPWERSPRPRSRSSRPPMPVARCGAARSGVQMSFPSIPTGRTGTSSRPASATASVSR
jgi:cytochrome c2